MLHMMKYLMGLMGAFTRRMCVQEGLVCMPLKRLQEGNTAGRRVSNLSGAWGRGRQEDDFSVP